MHSPQMTKKVRSEYVPWITDTIKKSIYHRDFLKKKAVKTGSGNVHEAYKGARNDLNELVKNTKANYLMSALNNTKKYPKEMWKMVNRLTNKQSKTTDIPKIIIDDKIIEELRIIRNTFNTFFNEIGDVFTKDLPGGNLRSKMKMRALLKIRRCNVITFRNRQKHTNFQLNFIRVFLSIPECDYITSPNFELGSHLHFTSEIGDNLAKGLPESATTPESHITPSNSIFEIQSLSEIGVFKLLSTIKSSKATGHDRISPKLLKDSAGVIAPTLTKIFN